MKMDKICLLSNLFFKEFIKIYGTKGYKRNCQPSHDVRNDRVRAINRNPSGGNSKERVKDGGPEERTLATTDYMVKE